MVRVVGRASALLQPERGWEDLTDLTGTLPDQSAFQGVLRRIWDLNLTLLSVTTSALQAGGDDGLPARPDMEAVQGALCRILGKETVW